MMPRIKSGQVIDPAALSATERQHFAERLYALHCKIFDGVEREQFYIYVIDSPAPWTRIRIFENLAGDWVGYCAVHRFHETIQSRSCVVFRAEAGILRAYRGRSMTLWFGFAEAIKFRLLHPFSTLYYQGCFVHPSVLYMFSRYFRTYYPRADEPLPRNIERILLEMADVFHISPVPGQTPMVRHVGWVTRESDRDRDYWRNHPNPSVKFYIQENPGYVSGTGLLTLVPLTFANIFTSLGRFLLNSLKRRIWRA